MNKTLVIHSTWYKKIFYKSVESKEKKKRKGGREGRRKGRSKKGKRKNKQRTSKKLLIILYTSLIILQYKQHL